MKTKHKLVMAGIAVAVVAVLGALTFVPSDIPSISVTTVRATVAMANVKNHPNACSQCPYAGCPYLNHLRQMTMEKGRNSGLTNPGQTCPYELDHGQRTIQAKPHKKTTIFVDENLTRHQAKPGVKMAAWEMAR